jgi:kynurenine formamidase
LLSTKGSAVKIIDLTQAMANGMPVMEGIEPPEFHDLATVATDGYAMSQYTFVNHTGTHVDAPAHQIANGASLDDIPLDRLVTDALTIDLSGHEPGPVGPADMAGALDQVRPGDLVLFRSGIGVAVIKVRNESAQRHGVLDDALANDIQRASALGGGTGRAKATGRI